MRNEFALVLSVRDYECDMQGVVNNAVYQNYLEHARHEFLKTRGLDFAELARQKIDLVVVRVELDYRRPLRSGDRFRVVTRVERMSPLRFVFLQEIFRAADDTLMLSGKIIGTALNERGRPELPPQVAEALASTVSQEAAGCSSR